MLIRSNPETSVGILVAVMALLGACSPATHPRAAKTASRLSGRDLISYRPQSGRFDEGPSKGAYTV